MSFAQDNGYTPMTFDEIMSEIREGINTQFNTSFTPETFIGTQWYRYMYALVQKAQAGEIKTSQVFEKLQQYIALTNERIQRPSVSYPGLVDAFQSHGYIASFQPPSVENAGTIAVCVDVDPMDPDFADIKLDICQKLKDFTPAGIVSQGTHTESIVLSNGQSFEYRFSTPTKIPVKLRLTLTISKNNLLTVPGDAEIRQILFDNINARYRLGWNFEPQRYFTQDDAEWASTVLLEWTDDDGESWNDTVFEAEFDDLFTFGLEDIQVVIN